MLEQAKRLMAAGFDGFKMICKPNARRKFKLSIDDEIFDPFYEEAEKRTVAYPVPCGRSRQLLGS